MPPAISLCLFLCISLGFRLGLCVALSLCLCVLHWACLSACSFFFFRFYLFTFRERGREEDREGEKHCCVREKQLPLARPLLGTWPTTQAYALTGNRTSDLSVRRPALNPLSHSSQGSPHVLVYAFLCVSLHICLSRCLCLGVSHVSVFLWFCIYVSTFLALSGSLFASLQLPLHESSCLSPLSSLSRCMYLSLVLLTLHFFPRICLFPSPSGSLCVSLPGCLTRPLSQHLCAPHVGNRSRECPILENPALLLTCGVALGTPALSLPPLTPKPPGSKHTATPSSDRSFIPQGTGRLAQPSNFFLRPSIPLSASMFLRQSPTSRISWRNGARNRVSSLKYLPPAFRPAGLLCSGCLPEDLVLEPFLSHFSHALPVT